MNELDLTVVLQCTHVLFFFLFLLKEQASKQISNTSGRVHLKKKKKIPSSVEERVGGWVGGCTREPP